MGRVGDRRHRAFSPERVGLLIFFLTLLFGARAPAYAEPSVELSGVTGLGVLTAGVTPGRFAISPSASLSVRGERGFFVARDTVSFLGATGGRFGINNETTVGGGMFWESVNVSAGLSLAEYSLPICGPRLCGQVLGLAPAAGARLDLFGPLLSGGLGVSLDCDAAWITGPASPVWSGISVRCSAGPILRFTFQRCPTRKAHPMRTLFGSFASLLVMVVSGYNTVDPDQCWPNTSGGFGGGGTIPISAGVGATTSSGDFDAPPKDPLAATATENPCVAMGSINVVDFKPAEFPSVTIVQDDGTGPGGWQEARPNLEFIKKRRGGNSTWYCTFTIGMPLRTEGMGKSRQVERPTSA